MKLQFKKKITKSARHLNVKHKARQSLTVVFVRSDNSVKKNRNKIKLKIDFEIYIKWQKTRHNIKKEEMTKFVKNRKIV